MNEKEAVIHQLSERLSAIYLQALVDRLHMHARHYPELTRDLTIAAEVVGTVVNGLDDFK